MSCCDLYRGSSSRYEVVVSDVTCYACVERIRNAIYSLIGASTYDYRADYRAKMCVFYITTNRDIGQEEVEKALIKASEGTPHSYRIISFKRLDI